MKLFKHRISRKDLENKVEELNKLILKKDEALKLLLDNQTRSQEDLKYKETVINRLGRDLDAAIENNTNLMLDNDQIINELGRLRKHIRKIQGSKGGLTAENNKLKQLVQDLTLKLEESMTDKYLIKKLPSEKVPHTQFMKIKSSSKQSNITRKMHCSSKKDEELLEVK